jgi:hypothetical protein
MKLLFLQSRNRVASCTRQLHLLHWWWRVHCLFPRKNLGQLLFYSVQSSTQEEHPIQHAISPTTTTRAFLNRTIPTWGSISWQLGTLKPSETPAPENVESRRGSNMFGCLVSGIRGGLHLSAGAIAYGTSRYVWMTMAKGHVFPVNFEHRNWLSI